MGCFEITDKYENCVNKISDLRIMVKNVRKRKLDEKEREKMLKKIDDDKVNIMKQIKILNIETFEPDDQIKLEYINEQFQMCLSEIEQLNIIYNFNDIKNDNINNNEEKEKN